MVTGCSYFSRDDGCQRKTELMDLTTNSWSEGPDFPYGTISSYSTISTSESVYVIGGYGVYDNVAEFKNYQWRLAGNLKHGRFDHESILIGNQVFIIGTRAWSAK